MELVGIEVKPMLHYDEAMGWLAEALYKHGGIGVRQTVERVGHQSRRIDTAIELPMSLFRKGLAWDAPVIVRPMLTTIAHLIVSNPQPFVSVDNVLELCDPPLEMCLPQLDNTVEWGRVTFHLSINIVAEPQGSYQKD